MNPDDFISYHWKKIRQQNPSTMKFENPYKGSPEPLLQLTARIPESSYLAIKQCRVLTGTIQNTVLILWKKLEDELRKHNINSPLDQARFEHFILNSVLSLPAECGSIIEPNRGGRSSGGVPSQSPNGGGGGGHDRGGVEAAGAVVAGKAAERADAKSRTRKGGGRKGTAKKA